MGWLNDERLVVVLEDSSALVYTSLGLLLKTISLGEVLLVNYLVLTQSLQVSSAVRYLECANLTERRPGLPHSTRRILFHKC